MEWGNDYEHGLIWQDFQHKQVVDHLNLLLDALISGTKEKETFYKTIKFVKDYSLDHFGLEELYMKNNNYPGMASHIREHRAFMKNFEKFISASIYHERESSSELLNKLTSWFFNHIHTSDKVLAEFLLKAGMK